MNNTINSNSVESSNSSDFYRRLMNQIISCNLISAQSLELYLMSSEGEWDDFHKMKDISAISEDIANKYMDISEMISNHFANENEDGISRDVDKNPVLSVAASARKPTPKSLEPSPDVKTGIASR